MSTVDRLAKIYETEPVEWRIGGEYKNPDKVTIDLMVRNLKRLLDEQGEDNHLAQVESGGIIMRRDGEHIDVFVHVGEYEEALDIGS